MQVTLNKKSIMLIICIHMRYKAFIKIHAGIALKLIKFKVGIE